MSFYLRNKKMLGKTTIAIISSLLAAPCFSGFYIGGSVGPEGASFTQKAHVTGSAQTDPQTGQIFPNSAFDVIDKNHFSGIGVFGSLFAGYGSTFHTNYYLAGELNANVSSVKHTLTNDEYIHRNFQKTSFTMENSLGASILPGYFLSDSTLAYGRVGYSNARLKIKESDPTIQSINKRRNGIRYGIGVRHALSPQFSLMMDYSQINYMSVKSNVLVPQAGISKHTSITPATAQVGFGLIYHFDQPEVYVK